MHLEQVLFIPGVGRAGLLHWHLEVTLSCSCLGFLKQVVSPVLEMALSFPESIVDADGSFLKNEDHQTAERHGINSHVVTVVILVRQQLLSHTFSEHKNTCKHNT